MEIIYGVINMLISFFCLCVGCSFAVFVLLVIAAFMRGEFKK